MDIKELMKKKVSAISLGCDKNRVDLEKMLFKAKMIRDNSPPDATFESGFSGSPGFVEI